MPTAWRHPNSQIGMRLTADPNPWCSVVDAMLLLQLQWMSRDWLTNSRHKLSYGLCRDIMSEVFGNLDMDTLENNPTWTRAIAHGNGSRIVSLPLLFDRHLHACPSIYLHVCACHNQANVSASIIYAYAVVPKLISRRTRIGIGIVAGDHKHASKPAPLSPTHSLLTHSCRSATDWLHPFLSRILPN